MGAAPSLTGLAQALGSVAGAYRTGRGLPYADLGAEIRQGTGEFNRPMFVNDVACWLSAIPADVRGRLHRGGRAPDVACGTG